MPASKNRIKVSVVVPVYNEAKTVATVLDRLKQHLKKIRPPAGSPYKSIRYEIIVVNDGSTDETLSAIRPYNRYRNIKIFSYTRNRGKGYALRYGFKRATGDIIAIQDADLEYHPRNLAKLLRPLLLDQCQVVYGSRLAQIPLNLQTLRSIKLPTHFLANKLLSFLTRLLYRTRLTDMETGYKLFTSQALKSLKLQSNGFEIEVELTAKLLLSGYQIKEIPITTRPRGYAEGKKISTRDGLIAIFDLFKYRFTLYHLLFIAILILAAIVRLWDFPNRYSLWSDQARDVLVGRQALQNLSPPLIGSFSSAGPFTFGPAWYYYSMIIAFLSDSHLAYWFGSVVLSLVSIAILMHLARNLWGTQAALITGIFAALSHENIQSTLASTQHTAIFPATTFFLYFLFKYLRQKHLSSLILASLAWGISLNFHYQTIYLLPLLLFVLVQTKAKPAHWLTAVSFAILPFLPLIIFDLTHQFWNLKHLYQYLTVDQYRLFVPNRWLTYALVFWPNYWSRVVGGFPWLASVTALAAGSFILYRAIKTKSNSPIFTLALGFFFAFFLFRYFRAERFYGYMVYFQPFIFLLSAWLVNQLIRQDKVIGYTILFFLIFGSYTRLWASANQPNPRATLDQFIQVLNQTYGPTAKFTLYDFSFQSTGCSLPLSLLLDDQNRSVDTGQKIGACRADICPPNFPLITKGKVGDFTCQLVDLSSKASTQLEKEGWTLLSPQEVYRMTVGWYQTEPSLN